MRKIWKYELPCNTKISKVWKKKLKIARTGSFNTFVFLLHLKSRFSTTVWHWCLGACLLSSVQECQTRLRETNLECSQLGQCCREVQEGHHKDDLVGWCVSNKRNRICCHAAREVQIWTVQQASVISITHASINIKRDFNCWSLCKAPHPFLSPIYWWSHQPNHQFFCFNWSKCAVYY